MTDINSLAVAYVPFVLQHLAVLGLCSLRLYAVLTMFPPTSSDVIPGTLRNGVALIFCLYVAIAQPESFGQSLNGTTIAIIGLRESFIGVVIGYAASTVFWVAEGAGAYLDDLTGYNNVQMTNPTISSQSTPSSILLGQIVTVSFWTLGGMQSLLGALYASYHWWPVASSTPLAVDFVGAFAMHQTDTLMQTTAKLATPMLLILLLIDIGLNLVSKAAQKLELNSLSQPVKGAVTVLMLALLTAVFVYQVRDALDLRLFRQQVAAIAKSSHTLSAE